MCSKKYGISYCLLISYVITIFIISIVITVVVSLVGVKRTNCNDIGKSFEPPSVDTGRQGGRRNKKSIEINNDNDHRILYGIVAAYQQMFYQQDMHYIFFRQI